MSLYVLIFAEHTKHGPITYVFLGIMHCLSSRYFWKPLFLWKIFGSTIIWDENTAFQFIAKHFQVRCLFVDMDQQCSGILNHPLFQVHSVL